MPELAHIYPIYRLNITSGRIAAADAGTLAATASLVRRLAATGCCSRSTSAPTATSRCTS